MFPGGDPFGQMFQMMGQMDQMMNQAFRDPFVGMPPAQPPPQSYHQHPQTAPRIEEVPHDAQMQAGRSASQPVIVEEPDEDNKTDGPPEPQYSAQPSTTHQPKQPVYQPAAVAPMADPFAMNPFGGMFGGLLGNMMSGMAAGRTGNGQVYTYSSSTVMRSGPDGVYHSSTTSRQAPGGVRETQKTIRDGRTGTESMTIARGMGEQERVVTRRRDASGQMITEEHHAGINPNTAHQFDEQWMQRAQQTMPPWMQEQSGRQRIASGRQQQQPQLALPSSASAGSGHHPQYAHSQQQQYYGNTHGQQQQYYSNTHGQHHQQQQQSNGASGWPGGYRM